MGSNPRAGSSPAPSKYWILNVTEEAEILPFQMKNTDKLEKKKGIFLVLWALCILGFWSVLPYVLSLGILSPSTPFFKVFILATIQAVLFFGIICWLSYLLVPKTDLSPFSAKHPLKRIVYPGIIVGVSVGFILHLLDITIFKNCALSAVHSSSWIGLLASFYGAINEEVFLRLFLFTLIYFLFGKIFRVDLRNRIIILWMTNVIVAIIFGLGHLPAAYKLAMPSSFETFRVLLLNGIPGIFFGWLYWSRGLWAAMTGHFTADLIVHVILIKS